MNKLKRIYLFWLLVKLAYAMNNKSDILISVYMGNEEDVMELVMLENDKHFPSIVTAELTLNKYELNEMGNKCCYHSKHGNCITSKQEETEASSVNHYNIHKKVGEHFVYKPCNTYNSEIHQEIQRKMIRFYDYEYDLSRPVELSQREMEIWRDKLYNSTRVENIIVPGKGTGRLYIKINTNGFLKGNYHFFLKMINAERIETRNVIVIVKEYPLEASIKVNNHSAENFDQDNKGYSLQVTARNNLVFENIIYDNNVNLIADKKNSISCSLIDSRESEFGILRFIKPGERINLNIKCGKSKGEVAMIRRATELELSIGWSIYDLGRSRRYRKTFSLSEENIKIEDTTRGVILLDEMNIILENKYGSTDYNFKNMQGRVKREGYLDKSEIGTIVLNNISLKDDILVIKKGILVDLYDISNNILDFSNTNLTFNLLKISEYDSLRACFENGNERLNINNIQSMTRYNSVLILGLVIKINRQELLEKVFKFENLLFNIQLNVELTQDNILNANNGIRYSKVEKLNYGFQIEFKLNDNYIYRGNIVKGETGMDRIIINGNQQNLRLEIMKIFDCSTNIRNCDTKIELLHQDSEGKKFEINEIVKTTTGRYGKVELDVALSNYIGEDEIRKRLAKSCIENSIIDLPYQILVDENKVFQIATIDNCGSIKISSEYIDFGTIPVGIFDNNKISESFEISVEKKDYDGLSAETWLCFSAPNTYALELMLIGNRDVAKKIEFMHKSNTFGELTTYVYLIDQNKISNYDLVIYSNFGESKAKIETGKSLDLSGTLKIYSNQVMAGNLNAANVIIGREILGDGNSGEVIKLEGFGIEVGNATVPKSLHLVRSVAIKCMVRSLDIKIDSVKVVNPLNSDYFSKEIIEMEKLPLSFILVNLVNNEEFPVQYSVQNKETLLATNSKTYKYIMENYAIYTEYRKNATQRIDLINSKHVNEFELLGSETYEEELAFNFPYRNLFFKRVRFDSVTGSLILCDECENESLVVRLIPENAKKSYSSIFISFGNKRISSWEVALSLRDANKEIVKLNFHVYETGKMTWQLDSNETHLDAKESSLLMPVLSDNIDLKYGLKLKKFVDENKIRQTIKILIVPWIEVSNDMSRIGYLMPKEKRIIPILVHNQILTSSSSKSKSVDLICSYNFFFKGLFELSDKKDKPLYDYSELFARKLVENDRELRDENMGISHYFPLNWKVPNILKKSGFGGGGFVKKITLINSSLSSNQNADGLKSVGFILEIQNPILCTNKLSEVADTNSEENEQEESEGESDEEEHMKGEGEACLPFNNIGLVKGFRVIWYPYNNFNPTNYGSVEILMDRIPKYNFKTSSYDYEDSEDDETDRGETLSRIFTHYLREHNSEESDYAYYIRINCSCILNQQYTFKFSIIHHNNIQNSVFVPPFGFNVTVQDYSLSWFRALRSNDKRMKDLSNKVCDFGVDLLKNNTPILLLNKNLLGSISNLDLGYYIDFGENKETHDEWVLEESNNSESGFNKEITKLFSLDNFDDLQSHGALNESLDKHFKVQIPEQLPSKTRIKFIITTLNANREAYLCKSKAYMTFEGVPTSPKDLVYSPLTSDSIKLSWTAPLSDGGHEVTEYEISLIPDLEINESGIDIDIITEKSKKSFAIIENLIPTITYRCEVVAINKMGKGKKAYVENVVSKESANQAFGVCNYSSDFKLLINENSRREMSWSVDRNLYRHLDEIYIYVFCVIHGKRDAFKSKSAYGLDRHDHKKLSFIFKAKSLCAKSSRGDLKCRFEEAKGTDSQVCDNYSFKVMRGDKVGECIASLDSVSVRMLGEYTRNVDHVNRDMAFSRRLSVKHILLNEEYGADHNSDSSGPFVHYPKSYNPEWDGGLNKMELKIDLLSQNSTSIHVRVDYLQDLDDPEGSFIAGDGVNGEYSYEISKRADNNVSPGTWSIYNSQEQIPSETGYSENTVVIMIINLIPETMGLLTIKEFDRNGNENSISKHIMRIPKRRYGETEVGKRKLLSMGEFLEVNLTSIIRGMSHPGFLGNSFFKGFRKLGKIEHGENKGGISSEHVELKMKTNSKDSSFLSNSLFVSSKMIIDNWPEDYERRLFAEIGIKISPGNLMIKNSNGTETMGRNEIIGTVSNYKPLSELAYLDSIGDEISLLFDGDESTGLEYYKKRGAFSNDTSFPYIKLMFNEPICVLFIRLHWKAGYSPISTVAKVKLRSRNESKTKERAFNPKIHSCDHSEKEARIDTMQILPPEEMVNVYLANPSNRYPSILEVTLSFIGFCRIDSAQTESESDSTGEEPPPSLVLSEIEISPCINNDLMISYSDPLSQRNNSLVKTKHVIPKSRLREKYEEMRKMILRNLEKEEPNEMLLNKYRNTNLDESNIHLELSVILSEENVLRSSEIPKKRLLVQDFRHESSAKAEEFEHELPTERKMIQKEDKWSDSADVNFACYLFGAWKDITIVLVISYMAIKSKCAQLV